MSALYMEAGGRSGLGLLDPKVLMESMKLWPTYSEQIMENMMRPEVRQLKPDLIIGSVGSSSYIIASLLNSTVINLCPMGPWDLYTTRIGNNFFPSQTPGFGGILDKPELFSQRLLNTFASKGMDFMQSFGFKHSYEFYAKKIGYNGGGDFDALIGGKTQLVLSNSHAITHEPQALLENVVHVGGIHIRPTKPLPQDLQQLLDSSPEGVILVSFGSTITPSSMSAEKRHMFTSAFKKLNHKIIWKWDADDIEDMPANVVLRSWLPQQDLLDHPNLKVFFTHGGLLSVMEAIYFETIIVGVPLMNDQVPNLIRMEEKSIGIKLDWDNLTADDIYNAIHQALTDKTMAGAMQRQGRLFRDRPEPPVKKAAWWVEFVLRHKGADFLKPRSMNLRFYQAWNLDILAVAVLVLMLFSVISWKFTICFWSLLCRCRSKKQKTD